MSGELPIFATYTQVFMRALGGYVITYFRCSCSARFRQDHGRLRPARTIAERIVEWVGPDRAILAVVLACGVLTYGGVSLFVVAFAIYPIANALSAGLTSPNGFCPRRSRWDRSPSP